MKMRVKIGETEFTFHSEEELKATLRDHSAECENRERDLAAQLRSVRKALSSFRQALRELEKRQQPAADQERQNRAAGAAGAR